MHTHPSGRRVALGLVSLAAVAALGCQPPPDDAGEGELGVVQVALTSVPSNGTCVRFTTTAGARVISQNVSGTANTQLVAALRGLPFGVPLSISAEAFSGTCTALTTASLATYLSDVQTATLVSGQTKALTFTLRPTGNVSGTADFVYLTMTPGAAGFPPIVIMQQGPIVTFNVANIGMVPTSALTASITMTSGGVGELTILPGSTCAGVLMPGQQCIVQTTMAPMTPGPKTGTLTVSAAQGGTLTAPLNGIGWSPARLVVTPNASFGSQPLFLPGNQVDLTVTNMGDQPTGPITLQVTNPEFQIASSQCGGLPGLGTCHIYLRFMPMTAGARSGALNLNAAPGGMTSCALTGTGTSPLTLAPTMRDFGAAPVGGMGVMQVFTVTNLSTMPTAPLVVVGTAAAFKITSDLCKTRSIGPGGTCTITVQLVPTVAGPVSGTLTVTGAPGWVAAATMSGAGI